MKKTVLISILSFLLVTKTWCQGGGGGVASIIVALSQRSTVLYGDTSFESSKLRITITETYAFRDKIKTTLMVTNPSDNFKILRSEDFTITDSEGKAIVINYKKPMVIPPKGDAVFGLMAESKASFKLYDIKINLKQIFSTGDPIAILKPNFYNLQLEGAESSKIGPLEITRTKCSVSPHGAVRAYFKLSYMSTNFLAMYRTNAKMYTATGKTYMNSGKKAYTTFYPEDKAAVTMLLEFENPAPNFTGQNCDKISLENVFVEYESKSDNKPLELHVYKNGLAKGESHEDKGKPEILPED